MADPDAGRPHAYSATTDFDSHSHEEMLSMVKGARPSAASELGDRLQKAETKLNQIAEKLKRSLDDLEWASEGGRAFREWAHDIAKSAMTLADYSGTAGRFMDHVGTVLGEVQRDIPKVPTDAKRLAAQEPANILLNADIKDTPSPLLSSPTAKEVAEAKGRVEDARQEAVRQMIKLSQAYTMSTDILNSSAPPSFPPAPQVVMPISSEDRWAREFGGSSTESGSLPAASIAAPKAQLHDSPHRHTGVQGPQASVGLPAGAHAPVITTRVDSVEAVTQSPDRVGTAPNGVTLPAPPAQGPPGPALPGGTVSAHKGSSANGAASPRTPTGVRGPVMPPRPSLVPGGVAPRVPTSDGIHGGRPIASGGSASQLPRGTVVGTERAAQHARPPMVGGVGGSPGTGGATPPPGRRLASEPGGVVGGRSGIASERTFTAGGSGLGVRGREGTPSGHLGNERGSGSGTGGSRPHGVSRVGRGADDADVPGPEDTEAKSVRERATGLPVVD